MTLIYIVRFPALRYNRKYLRRKLFNTKDTKYIDFIKNK